LYASIEWIGELHNKAYENAKIYKVKTKAFHDKMISHKSFEPNKKVWLSNSKLKLFFSKLKSRWDGTFVVQQVFLSEVVQILDPQDSQVLMVNDQCLKLVVTNDIGPSLIESFNLVDPIYYD